MKITTFIFTLIIMSTHVGLIQAEENDYQTEPDGRLSLGVALVAAPKFEGSKDHQFLALPIIEYDHDLFFVSTTRGAGVKLINHESFQLGPVVNYRFGRDQDDSDELKGLGDVKGGAEAGLHAGWRFCEPLALKMEFRHGLGAAKGYTVDLGLGHTTQLNEDLTLALGLEASYADRDYNQEYFGVDQKQSLKSGYQEYNPGGGVKHVAAKASLTYGLTGNLDLGVYGEYKRLTGPAADSPLVKNGSANQVSSGLALTWNY